jgi:hypothetical protein
MKKFLLGVLVCYLIMSILPVSAAIEGYLLNISDCKLVVDGQPWQSFDLPVLNYQGYNYVPVSVLKSITEKIGATLNFDAATKSININTEVKSMSTVTAPAQEIQFDDSGMPIGAQFAEHTAGGKTFTALDVNGEIYISSNDLYKLFKVKSTFVNPQNGTATYSNDNGSVTFLITDKNNQFSTARDGYCKLSLFSSIIGE